MVDYHVALNSASTLSNGAAGPSWTTSFTLPGVATQMQLNGYLPLAGGALTGPLNLTNATATAAWSSSPVLTMELPAKEGFFKFYNQLDDSGVASGVVQVHSPSQAEGTIPWNWWFSGKHGCLLNSSSNAMVAAPGNMRRLLQPITVSAKDGDWIAFPIAFSSTDNQHIMATAMDLGNAPVTACVKAGYQPNIQGFHIGLYLKDGTPVTTPVSVTVLAIGVEA
ncbi:hypothetical protein E3E12_08180 [Formicincola oecophyllae]|uniref:Uncharacterized protein n=1 Tax=Formicincola oecophyllae TaxID=2558361 RepID=A0A4Y6U9M2_9PROT|nr:hypothetical protein [Formicincola oecophyllae]QDH14173.1 hypothetical protein E3E12_08180 [Formicincola oecophyllae]